MNILKFAKNTMLHPEKYQLRTASGRVVEISYISKEGPFPIRGVIKDSVPGLNTICEWDENGYPYNLPYNHGLNLLPYLAKTVYERISNEEVNSIDLC